LGIGGVAIAQTSNNPSTTTTSTTGTTTKTVPSNYAVDVNAGQATLKKDPVAAAQSKEVKAVETSKGEVDNEPAEVKEAIEADEATEEVEAVESESENSSDKKSDTKKSSDSDKKADTNNGLTNGAANNSAGGQ